MPESVFRSMINGEETHVYYCPKEISDEIVYFGKQFDLSICFIFGIEKDDEAGKPRRFWFICQSNYTVLYLSRAVIELNYFAIMMEESDAALPRFPGEAKIPCLLFTEKKF